MVIFLGQANHHVFHHISVACQGHNSLHYHPFYRQTYTSFLSATTDSSVTRYKISLKRLSGPPPP